MKTGLNDGKMSPKNVQLFTNATPYKLGLIAAYKTLLLEWFYRKNCNVTQLNLDV